jgi:hypothetical protein
MTDVLWLLVRDIRMWLLGLWLLLRISPFAVYFVTVVVCKDKM